MAWARQSGGMWGRPSTGCPTPTPRPRSPSTRCSPARTRPAAGPARGPRHDEPPGGTGGRHVCDADRLRHPLRDTHRRRPGPRRRASAAALEDAWPREWPADPVRPAPHLGAPETRELADIIIPPFGQSLGYESAGNGRRRYHSSLIPGHIQTADYVIVADEYCAVREHVDVRRPPMKYVPRPAGITGQTRGPAPARHRRHRAPRAHGRIRDPAASIPPDPTVAAAAWSTSTRECGGPRGCAAARKGGASGKVGFFEPVARASASPSHRACSPIDLHVAVPARGGVAHPVGGPGCGARTLWAVVLASGTSRTAAHMLRKTPPLRPASHLVPPELHAGCWIDYSRCRRGGLGAAKLPQRLEGMGSPLRISLPVERP